MKKLLDGKYSNVLELIEELGKIRMEDIDSEDLERLQEELQEAGYETYVDDTTDYLIGERRKKMTVQRVNMDLNKELWKQVGIRAIEEGINKKDLVEKALENYLKDGNEDEKEFN